MESGIIIRDEKLIETLNVIDFNNKPTAAINLETLSHSATNYTASGMLPMSRPVHHYQFLLWLQQLVEDKTGQATIEPINISARHAKRIRFSPTETFNPKDPCPIDRLNIERLTTKIVSDRVSLVGGSEIQYAIAVSYTEKGIQVAIGGNVFACANMNIFGNTKYATFGSDKLTFEAFKDLIKRSVENHEIKRANDIEIIRSLQSVEVTKERESEIIHELFEFAVDANMKRVKANMILNVSQVIKMQEEIIRKRKTDPNIRVTAWDLTQAGTEHLKGDRQDMVQLLDTNAQFNEYIVEKFIR